MTDSTKSNTTPTRRNFGVGGTLSYPLSKRVLSNTTPTPEQQDQSGPKAPEPPSNSAASQASQSTPAGESECTSPPSTPQGQE